MQRICNRLLAIRKRAGIQAGVAWRLPFLGPLAYLKELRFVLQMNVSVFGAFRDKWRIAVGRFGAY